MKKYIKLLQGIFIVLFLFGLITPVATTAVPAPSRMSASLAELVAEDPGGMIRVIVQKADGSDQAERFVGAHGGKVLKDLDLIQAFAAQLPAKHVTRLAKLAAVNWIALDSPVVSTAKPVPQATYSLLDNFSTVAYNNNDGFASWTGDWLENDIEGAGPGSGDVYIANDELFLRGSSDGSGEITSIETVRDEFNTPAYNNNDGTVLWYTEWIEFSDDGSASSGNILVDNNQLYLDNKDGGVLENVQRPFYTSGATNVQLTFDYIGFGEGGLDIFAVDVSSDGTNFTTLESVEVVGNVSGTKSYDLTSYLSAESKATIRFRLVQGFAATTQYMAFDNIQVETSYAQPGNQTLPDIARQADLSENLTSANLTVSYRTGPGVDLVGDNAVLEISSDGGTNYFPLYDFNFLTSGLPTAMSFDVLEYASASTKIRFKIASGFTEPDEYLSLLSVQIEYQGSSLPNSTFLDTIEASAAWDLGYTGADVGVAVIDSGISTDRDFNSILKMSFNPNSNTVNDVFGHGTHVAGIIAGNGTDSAGQYMGIAPDVNLIGLKISDENGLAYELDTVDAMQWVFDNKDQYNIRVVNLSIQSTIEQSYHDSALNAAAEILWFNGVVVIAATGNWYGGNVYPLNAAPGNDPFIITVGATNEKGTTKIKDDVIPSFSVMGYTQDGFSKPEIFAPGKDIISVLSKDSSWDQEYPERSIFASQYFRISGTSMATPMVSGAVALLLQAEPGLTPDQVKYRLMHAHNWIGAYPYLSIEKILTTPTMESANQDIIPHMLLAKMAMIAYWASAEGEENIDWENVDWAAVNWNAVNWNAVNWNAVNWNAVNWNAVNWNAVNWNAVNWNAVNWNAVNWNAVNWNAVNWNAVNWNAVNWNAVSWDE